MAGTSGPRGPGLRARLAGLQGGSHLVLQVSHVGVNSVHILSFTL